MAKKKQSKKTLVTPLADRIFIKLIAAGSGEEKTESGIIIPETVKKEEKGVRRGEVVAVGAGRVDDNGNRIQPEVKVGDKVLFSWGDEMEIDGEEYWIVSESNILGIIN